MSVTIADLAKLSGVTEGTVSRALRGDRRVAAATAARIREVADRHGYLPNLAARELIRGRTNLVGLVMSGLVSSMFNEIVEGALETLAECDVDAVIALTHDRAGIEEQTIRRLLGRRVQGFIVQPGVRLAEKQVYAQLKQAELPVVFFDRVHADVPRSTVVLADNTGGGRLAAERFAATGRRRLAALHDPASSGPEVVRQRVQGFLAAAGDRAEPVRGPDRLFSGGYDAVFAPSDSEALQVLRAAASRGVRVPEELAVIGFDDLDFAPLLPVPLTTIHQPQREMGIAAARALLDLRERRDVPGRIELPVTLVARQSG